MELSFGQGGAVGRAALFGRVAGERRLFGQGGQGGSFWPGGCGQGGALARVVMGGLAGRDARGESVDPHA